MSPFASIAALARRANPGRALALSVLLVASAAPLHADFDYPDFTSTAGLTLVEDAVQSGGMVVLTPAALSQRGALWTDVAQPIAEGFETTFTIEHAALSGGADGSAFVIQNAGTAALGNHASAMGYGGFLTSPDQGIASSVAIEFDDFANSNVNDPSGNHISVQTRGADPNSTDHQYSLGATSAIAPIAGVHTVKVVYLAGAPASPGTLEVYFDDLVTPALAVTIDLVAEVGGPTAHLGFTAGTGGLFEEHRVHSWSFTASGGGPGFRRGDCNEDTTANIADAVFLLAVLFPLPSNPVPSVGCEDACDGNDDGTLNIADVITLLNALFGVPPVALPPPGATCGNDPTTDSLDCANGQGGC